MNTNFSNEEALDAKESLEVLFEISELLNCQLDRQTLSVIVSMVENGVSPVAIVSVIKEIRKEIALSAQPSSGKKAN